MENCTRACYNQKNGLFYVPFCTKIISRGTMKKKNITAIVAILFTIALCVTLFACDKKEQKINYAIDNSFVVLTRENQGSLVFEPIANAKTSADGSVVGDRLQCEYGVIFYVGAGIEPTKYTYLATALAKQGYLVVIPKAEHNMTYADYKTAENAFATYPDVKFFIAGHSHQGGAAAIRRAAENKDKVAGVILLAPVANRHELIGEDGNPVKDENGVTIYVADNLLDCALPILLVESDNDKVRTQDQANDAKARLKDGYVSKIVQGGNHTAFAEIDVEDDLPIKFLPTYTADINATTIEQKANQRSATCDFTLAFLRSVVLG